MVEEETYLEWFEQIKEMGANTIRVSIRMNPDFYSALYNYNTSNEEPLYLIQGIEIEEYMTNTDESLYGYKDDLLYEAYITIDAVHGSRYVLTEGIAGNGLYSKDVSEWTIGYIFSNIGKDETIAYTDNTDTQNNGQAYEGTYYYTEANTASETETIIAELMDKMTKYEIGKYKEQKLISVMINCLNDVFKYKDNVNVQLGKMAHIDMNNIKGTENLQVGQLVTYDLLDDLNTWTEILADEEIEEYKEILETIDTNTIYDGYVEFINKYYNSPVLIANFGFSTSRMIEKTETEPITEEQQGEKILYCYDEFVKVGCCGGIISSWQDNWSQQNWNVKYSTEELQEIYWFNKQSTTQCFGIIAFEAEDRDCYVDGDIDEWENMEPVATKGELEIYLKYDYENVYIMVKNISDKNLYIPLDITPNSGSYEYENLTFNNAVDFIVKIDGEENSEILVQEYYDSIRAIYGYETTGIFQYSDVVSKYTSNFVSMRALLQKQTDVSVDVSLMTLDERIEYRRYKTYNTGKLVYGNGNPNSEDYNSLADFCFGENCVEIQIPWELINFSAPNELKIHDDYYENFGVENIEIDEIKIGVGTNNQNNINLEAVKLEAWNKKVNIRERLKKSYYIIQESWSK